MGKNSTAMADKMAKKIPVHDTRYQVRVNMSTAALTCDDRFVDVAHAAIAVLVIENNASQAFDDTTARTASRSPCHATTQPRTKSDTCKSVTARKGRSHREAAIAGTWKKAKHKSGASY